MMDEQLAAFERVAREAVNILESYQLKTPKLKVLSDGKLGGYWRCGKVYVTVEFEEDGEHVWTVSDGRNYISGTWDVKNRPPVELVMFANICESDND